MPRSARTAGCALGLAGVCVLAATIPAAAAGASTLKRASATATARVTVSSARSVTTTMSATAVAAVPGAARTIRVTRSASATRTATAAASSAGRKTASARATTTAKARARAKALALKSARAQARARATALAAAAAAAKARAAAAAAAGAAARLAAEIAARQQAVAAGPTPTTPTPTPTPTPTTPTSTTPNADPCGGETVTDNDGQAMTCSFSDEFDGTTVDPAKWTALTTAGSGYRNNLDECFVDSPDTIAVSDGTLKLTTRAAPGYACADRTTDYVSGSIMTAGRFSQTYGTYSIRAKFPAATVAGLHSALWMWPDDVTKYTSWPRSGEIDIAEMYSVYPDRVIPYVHYVYDPKSVQESWTGTPATTVSGTGTNLVTNNFCMLADPDEFHTYTLSWQPGRIAILFDGRNCMTNNYVASDLPAAAPFDQPFFLILTQALGSAGTVNAPTAATPSPATTEVDYVRVWK